MVQKTMGAVRTSVSSSSRIGQSLLEHALADGSFLKDTRAVATEMADRYNTAVHALELHKDRWDLLSPLPCNSGYFFCLKCAGSSEYLRTVLLEQHGVGTVSLGGNLLRIAYSGIDREDIAEVVDIAYRAAEALWT
jgi:DNA-binding transcriptional MocR family regulator